MKDTVVQKLKKQGRVLLLAALVLSLGFLFYSTGDFFIDHAAENSTASLLSIAEHSTDISYGVPTRLVIPSISVDAPVIPLGLEEDGTVAAPEGADEVAWYQLGPRPGEKGSAVISGHYGTWKNGSNSVFDNLQKIAIGEKIYVQNEEGELVSFTVKSMRIYDPKESVPEVFNKNDGVYLNLITCNGDWVSDKNTYSKRLVVFTEKT
ncbi:MAG: class F sortase [bacterium]|nr:class F sortase [bacterium]